VVAAGAPETLRTSRPTLGLRDRAIIAELLGRALRRCAVAALTMGALRADSRLRRRSPHGSPGVIARDGRAAQMAARRPGAVAAESRRISNWAPSNARLDTLGGAVRAEALLVVLEFSVSSPGGQAAKPNFRVSDDPPLSPPNSRLSATRDHARNTVTAPVSMSRAWWPRRESPSRSRTPS
jgi:hypothetical protein